MTTHLPFDTDADERREIGRLMRRFSLAKAILAKAERKPLTGVEAELRELTAGRTKLPFAGNIQLPSVLYRTGSAGDFQTTGTGEAFVPTDVPQSIGSARQNPLLDALGVRTIQSTGGDVQLPKFTAGTVKVKAEATDADSSAAATATVTLSPQRATASTLMTQQLLVQGGADSVINSVVAELRADIARLIDRTAFNLLVDSTNGITTNVEEATSSTDDDPPVVTQRPLTQDMLDDMMRAAFEQGARVSNMSYVASPAGFEDVQGIQTNNVHALHRPTTTVNGRPFYASQELVDHTDGTARLIVGDFEQGLIKADFGLLDVGVNPHTFDQSGQVRVTVHQYFDVQILDEGCFSLYREEV